MKVSIAIATKGRTNEFIFSLTSYIINADDNSNVEYIIMVDHDDLETIDALEKIVNLAHVYGAEIKIFVSDTVYGYEELERYWEKAGEIFTGDCIIPTGDDNFPITKGWDTRIIEVLAPYLDEPTWIGIVPLNEHWKGYATMVGINRKWYEITGRVTGTRAMDVFIPNVVKRCNVKCVRPDVDFIHLQRGKLDMSYEKDGKVHLIYGLPSDGRSGFNRNTGERIPPMYEVHEGVGLERVEDTANKLKKWMEQNGK